MAGFLQNKAAISTPIQTTGCATCGLAAGCRSPKMLPTGEGKEGILIIAEAPGQSEDEEGVQLIGKAGQRLRRTLREFKFDLDRDCRKTNACCCRPPDNETPTPDQVAACRKRVFAEIERFKPRVIIPMGSAALLSVLGNRWRHDSDFSINRWRNLTIPDQGLNAWVCPTFHPSYVERSMQREPVVEVLWRRDLAKALSLSQVPVPRTAEPEVRMIRGTQVNDYLLNLWQRSKKGESRPFHAMQPGTKDWKTCWRGHPEWQDEMLAYQKCGVPVNHTGGLTIFWDYEATGLKMYKPGHGIRACSIAETPDLAYAWAWWEDPQMFALFRAIMESELIRKGGANNKYEHVTTRQMLGFEVRGWWYDIVIGAHVLDNRQGNANVAFQTYTRLGVVDFKSETEALLKGIDPKDKHSFNRIDKIPKRELLLRCGRDSAYEYAIALNQRKDLGY